MLLTAASLLVLALVLPGRWQDLTDLMAPLPVASLPADTPGRARVAAELAAAPSPAADAREALWRLTGDRNDFVRGQALEALAHAKEGLRTDPRRAERLRQIASEDTDWNRRSACVLLIQLDLVAAVPLVDQLWSRTTNPNTKRALLEALRERDGAELRTALGRRKSALLQELVR